MKKLEDFHEENIDGILKRRTFVLAGEPVNSSKRFRVFNSWPHRYDIDSIFCALERVKMPLYLTFDARIRDTPKILSPLDTTPTVNMEDLCGQIISIVVDQHGFSADCVLLGHKANILSALRGHLDTVAPRLRLFGNPVQHIGKITNVIGIDLYHRIGDDPGKVEFYNDNPKPEFYLNPVLERQDPALVKATLRYPWPVSLDDKALLAVAKEQFGNPSVRKFPKLVRRIDKDKLPHECILQEEVVGLCESTQFNEDGLLIEFVLRLPNGVQLEKDLKADPEALMALPFIVTAENGDVLRFGDVFVVEVPKPGSVV